MTPNVQSDELKTAKPMQENNTLWLTHLINISNQLQDFSHPRTNLENILWIIKNIFPFKYAALALFNCEKNSPEMIFYHENVFNTEIPISNESLHIKVFENIYCHLFLCKEWPEIPNLRLERCSSFSCRRQVSRGRLSGRNRRFFRPRRALWNNQPDCKRAVDTFYP